MTRPVLVVGDTAVDLIIHLPARPHALSSAARLDKIRWRGQRRSAV